MSTPLPNPIDIRAGADQVIAYLRQRQQIQAMQALEQTVGWCVFLLMAYEFTTQYRSFYENTFSHWEGVF